VNRRISFPPSAASNLSFLQKLLASTLQIKSREFSENQLYHFQEQKDEMTDDELRLWMLLAYARPCKHASLQVLLFFEKPATLSTSSSTSHAKYSE
jgi:hypothetical protein